MKRKVLGALALLLVCMLAALGFTACGNGNGGVDHLHCYDEIVSPEYLKSAATCESAAVYYKSCSGCEAKSEETFEYGTALGHNYQNGVCTECGGKENGSGGGETHEHSYSSDWTIDIEATCTAKGEKSHHCTAEGCTAKSDVTEIDLADHNYVDGVCTECGDKKGLEEATGLSYILSSDGTYYIVSGIGTETRTAFAVPATYNGLPVKEIGEKAFYECSGLIEIKLSINITIIANYAFYGCSGLTGIELPSGLTEIGSYAFCGCVKLASITLPGGLIGIGSGAFSNCTILITINFIGTEEEWNAITKGDAWKDDSDDFEIEYNPVHQHSYMETVIEPTCTEGGYTLHKCSCGDEYTDNATQAKGHAYGTVTYDWSTDYTSCTATRVCGNDQTHAETETVTASKTVTQQRSCEKDELATFMVSFPNTAFAEQKKENVKTAEKLGHNYSSNWTIDIEATCTAKGEKSHHCTVEGCTAKSDVTEIDFAAHNYSSDWTIDIEATCTTKGEKSHHCTVEGCTAKSDVTEIDFADHHYVDGECTECGDRKSESKLEEATGLEYTLSSGKSYYIVSGIGTETRTSFAIPSTYNGNPVKEIGKNAFFCCSRLGSIEIPSGVTSIGYQAFYECDSLTSIEIPAGVTSIGSYAFSECSRLTSVTFGENSALTSIGDNAFSRCSSLTSIEIPAGVTSIGSSVFYYCANLTSIEIPAGVTSIGSNAFLGCSSLTSIEIPSGVTSIGYQAFCECDSLTSIEIPAGVTSIGNYAFKGCRHLTSVTFGENSALTSIGQYSFQFCYKLVEVYNLSSLSITKGASNYGYVGYYALDVYTTKDVESKLTTTNDGYLFYADGDTVYLVGYTGTDTKLTLPETFNGKNYDIYQYAFSGSSLTSIEIPAGVTSIGGYAFYECDSLTSIEIPAGVTSIGFESFYSCSSLTSVYYTGSAEDWNKISIGYANGDLTSATVYYYSETQPTVSGNYWHYDENGEIVVW